MTTMPLIEYAEAAPEVRAVYDDIMATRKTDWINNFWKALANDPATLRRTLGERQGGHGAGHAFDPAVKELIYLAVSITNGCQYCMASHGISAKRLGMTKEMFGVLLEIVGRENETNRLAYGYRVRVDVAFKSLF